MDYIVLDMEWNQPWPGSPSSKKVLPVDIRGEIIQIGAVRVSEEQFVQDEFQIMVKPKYYRHLNRRVSKLTGIKEARLREEGIPFPEAMERFRRDVAARPGYFPELLERAQSASGLGLTAQPYKRPKPCPDAALAPYFSWKGDLEAIAELSLIHI